MADSGGAIGTLVRFSRSAADAGSLDEIWALLVSAVVDAKIEDAVAAVAITERGPVLVASQGLPIESWSGSADTDDLTSIGTALLEACKPTLAHQRVIPLVSTGDLLGLLVLFTADPARSMPQDGLLEGLVDIAATALDKAHQFADLSKSYRDLRASREILSRTEKLRSLGQMAAGISHDLVGILNGLSLPAQLLRRQVKDPDQMMLIESLEQTVRRGVETVERLRNFSRQEPVGIAVRVSVNPLLREAAELSKPRVQGRSKVVLALGEPPEISMNGAELLTSVMNLIANAADALQAQRRGTITITSLATDGGNTAEISVSDDGPGMSPEVKGHVFEPFFTTKGDAGTGLGLSMVFASVQRHRGTIHVESEPGKGATFTLRFPAAG